MLKRDGIGDLSIRMEAYYDVRHGVGRKKVVILLGAAGGDIAGSRFERNNYKGKDFELFTGRCCFTDDTVMTMAIAEAILRTRQERPQEDKEREKLLYRNAEKEMREFGRTFPNAGYGGNFLQWLESDNPVPYNSFGNGSAMRVSACGWAAMDADEAAELARIVSEPTHNHKEGIKAAIAVALAIFHARSGMNKQRIADALHGMYDLDFSLDEIRSSYTFDVSCQGSVPQAIVAFLEGSSYEDTLRSAVSIGGDSDTIAAIAGSIAEAYYGIPEYLQEQILSYLRGAPMLLDTIRRFNEVYPKN